MNPSSVAQSISPNLCNRRNLRILLRNSAIGHDLFRSFGGAANVNLGHQSGSLGITLRDGSLKFLDVLRVDEINCAAAKSTASHSGSVNAPDLLSKLNHYIQLVATHFVIIAQAVV